MLKYRPTVVTITPEDMEDSLTRFTQAASTQPTRQLGAKTAPQRRSTHSKIPSTPAPGRPCINAGPSRLANNSLVLVEPGSFKSASQAEADQSIADQQHVTRSSNVLALSEAVRQPESMSPLSNYLSKSARQGLLHVGKRIPSQLQVEEQVQPGSRSLPLLHTRSKENSPIKTARARSQSYSPETAQSAGKTRPMTLQPQTPAPIPSSNLDLVQSSTNEYSFAYLDSSPLDELMARLRSVSITPGPRSRSRSTLLTPTRSARLLHGDLFYDHPAVVPDPSVAHNATDMVDNYVNLGPPLVRDTQESNRSVPRRASTRISNHNSSYYTGGNISRRSRTGQYPESSLSPSPGVGAMDRYHTPREETYSSSMHFPNTPRLRPPRSAVRPCRTPRVRVYDDGLPADFQPQTPAELRIRHATLPNLRSTASTRRSEGLMMNLHPAIIPPGESRYPLLSDPYPQAATAPEASSSVQPSTASTISSANPVRAHQENVFDPTAMGMEAERQAWAARRTLADGSTSLLQTPPQEGRFERFLR